MAPDMIIGATNATGTLAKAASLSSRAYVTFLAGDGDRLREGCGGARQGLEESEDGIPARGSGVARRAGGTPPYAGGSGLYSSGDRTGLPTRKPDPVRYGLLRYQLFQASYLGEVQ